MLKAEALEVYEYSDDIKVYTDPYGKLKAGTGATVWDSALVVSKYLQSVSTLEPRKILELGSGTGLLGIVCAQIFPSAQITLSDKASVLPLLELNQKSSGLTNVDVKLIDWEIYLKAAISATYDLIVFSDLITWPELYDPLLETLRAVSDKNTLIIFANESRNFEKEAVFYAKLSENFTLNYIPKEELHPQYQSEDIYIFKSTLK